MDRQQVSSNKHSIIESFRGTWASRATSLSFSVCIWKRQLMRSTFSLQLNETWCVYNMLVVQKEAITIAMLLIVIGNRLKVSIWGDVVSVAEEMGSSGASRGTVVGRQGREVWWESRALWVPPSSARGPCCQAKALAERDHLFFQQKWTFPWHPFHNMAEERLCPSVCLWLEVFRVSILSCIISV